MKYQDDQVTLHHGDCLDVLASMDGGAARFVVTDPPYGINTKSDGFDKLDPWADLCNAAHWYAMWLRECRRVLRHDGCLWSFLNWRSLPTFQRASCMVGWPIESLLVWDKMWIGPGGTRGLRPSYELVALFVMPSFSIEDRGVADIVRVQASGHKPNGHPAEKPVDVVNWILRTSGVAVGDVVLDPFMGSGTTGEAALKAGARFIGCETNERWFDVAKARVRSSVSLFAGGAA